MMDVNKKRDLLVLTDFSYEDFQTIFRLSKELKTTPLNHTLKNKVLGMIFTKSSTRTRVSFEVGISQLGGQALFLSPHDIQLGRGETIEDTARVLSRYLDGMILRAHDHDTLESFARFSSIPVINGLTDLSHPCQVLTDLFTILEKTGQIQNQKIAYLGDCKNNMAYSWIIGAAMMGCHLVLSGHEHYQSDPRQIQSFDAKARENGGSIRWMADPREAVHHADVVYTDVWTSMGQEAESEKRKKELAPWQINEALIQSAKKDVLFMHCLPAHRGEEVTHEVIEGPHSVVWDQAENRMHVQKAILTLIFSA
jgi:ornithine carbamoyltransferase